MIKLWASQCRLVNQSSEKYFILLLILLSVLVRLINLDSPLFTGNSFRQTMTAITVWTLVNEGISVFGYQTPVFGPPWTIPLEFPIYQLTVAFIVKLGIGNIDVAGRVAAIAYFYVSAIFLFLVCQNHINKIAATCVLLFYVWSPFMIVWSRNFMIDYASVAFSLGYFYFFSRWLDDSRKVGLLVLAIVLGILGFLIKVTTLPTVLVPMAYLVLRKMLASLQAEKYQLRRYIKANIGFLASLAAVFVLPVIPFFIWLQYSDAVKAASEFSSVLTSSSLSEWNYGTWLQKTTIGNWATILQRIISYVVTLPGLMFLIFGPWLYFRSSRNGGEFVVMFALAAFLTIFTFFNLYWVHDYYLMAVSPAVSIAVGFCCYLLLVKVFDGNFSLKLWFYVPVLIISIVLYSTRSYLKWSLELSYDDRIPTLSLAKTIRDNTTESDYVIIADVFNWDPQYLYYAKRKGFMLWHFEGDRSNQFFKKHNFTTIVHIEPHEKLFSNWKYRKLLAVNDKFKVVRVSDTPLN